MVFQKRKQETSKKHRTAKTIQKFFKSILVLLLGRRFLRLRCRFLDERFSGDGSGEEAIRRSGQVDLDSTLILMHSRPMA